MFKIKEYYSFNCHVTELLLPISGILRLHNVHYGGRKEVISEVVWGHIASDWCQFASDWCQFASDWCQFASDWCQFASDWRQFTSDWRQFTSDWRQFASV